MSKILTATRPPAANKEVEMLKTWIALVGVDIAMFELRLLETSGFFSYIS